MNLIQKIKNWYYTRESKKNMNKEPIMDLSIDWVRDADKLGRMDPEDKRILDE